MIPTPIGTRRRASHSTLGRIAAAMMNARKSSAMTMRSFQSASADATTATTMRDATRALRAVSCMSLCSPE